MAILILMPDRNNADILSAIKQIAPEEELRVWPEIGCADDIEYAIVWDHPAGELNKFPNLKAIASFGAGVDHILKDPDLPEGIPITRFVDETLSHQMAEYVAGVILNHRLRLTEYREYQAASVWRPQEPRVGNHVCLLGLGQIGTYVAAYLQKLDFRLSGWSRSEKNIAGMSCYHGPQGLDKALENTDYIVNLLPLTPETKGILNKNLFFKAPKGAYVINAGRGPHLNENDLLEAIYQEHLSGACLDVFSTEPLDDMSPFWRHPKISITPHIASVTRIDRLTCHLMENYFRMKKGQPLNHLIDRKKAY